MTKKDYILLAATIAPFVKGEAPDAGLNEPGFVDLAHALADRLAMDNAAFNRATFLRACGIAA